MNAHIGCDVGKSANPIFVSTNRHNGCDEGRSANPMCVSICEEMSVHVS